MKNHKERKKTKCIKKQNRVILITDFKNSRKTKIIFKESDWEIEQRKAG